MAVMAGVWRISGGINRPSINPAAIPPPTSLPYIKHNHINHRILQNITRAGTHQEILGINNETIINRTEKSWQSL